MTQAPWAVTAERSQIWCTVLAVQQRRSRINCISQQSVTCDDNENDE